MRELAAAIEHFRSASEKEEKQPGEQEKPQTDIER
jgi:hypothetical protein